MHITELPFNRHIGLRQRDDGALMLDDSESLRNHVGTVHAGALFTLAEAASGAFLQRRFSDLADRVAPLLRTSEIKYRRPASGEMHAEATVSEEEADRFIEQLNARGRATVSVSVKVKDRAGDAAVVARFDWFVGKLDNGLL